MLVRGRTEGGKVESKAAFCSGRIRNSIASRSKGLWLAAQGSNIQKLGPLGPQFSGFY